MRTAVFVLSLFCIAACLGSQIPTAVMTAAPAPVSQQICAGILGDSIQITRLGLGRQRLTDNKTNIEMTIANTSGQDISNISWGIASDDGQFNGGTVNMPRCSSITVSLFWPSTPGSHTFTGDVDPQNTLHESEAGFTNNHRTFTYNPLSAESRTQELDYEKARAAGALFADNKTTTISTCARLGVEDAARSRTYGVNMPGVIFVADCPSAASAFGMMVGTGGTADPEAYKDFRLKNGWKVKSVALKFTTNLQAPASDLHDSLEDAQSPNERRDQIEGFSVLTIPSEGSDNPYVHLHVSSRVGGFLGVYVKIIIEGPLGTDPYGATANTCETGYVSITTASGAGCARMEDVQNCASNVPLGGTACEINADCLRGFICPTNVCAHKCVRGHAP